MFCATSRITAEIRIAHIARFHWGTDALGLALLSHSGAAAVSFPTAREIILMLTSVADVRVRRTIMDPQ